MLIYYEITILSSSYLIVPQALNAKVIVECRIVGMANSWIQKGNANHVPSKSFSCKVVLLLYVLGSFKIFVTVLTNV